VVQSCTRVLISWDYAERGAAGVRIYRGGTFIGGVSGETRYYVDAGLALDTVYTYTVTAWNANGESAPSRPVELKTRPPSEECKEEKR
jgi:hypothetical protein